MTCTTSQNDTVTTIVASIQRSGHDVTVTTQDDGTVRVQRVGAESYAIIGKRGGVRWAGGKSIARF